MIQGSSELPKDILLKKLPRLSGPIGENFTTVTDLLLAEKLITQSVLYGITSQPNLTDKDRGSKVVHALLDKITDSDEPVQCLLKVCTVLEDDDVESDKLRQHGKDMRKQLSAEPSTSQAAAIPVAASVTATTVTVIPPTEYKADIAYDVLKTNTSRIKESGIGLDYLAGKLAEAKIITDSEKRQASDMWTGRTADQRIDELLTTLKATVKIDGSCFGWLIQVLRDMDTVLANKIADELVEKYKGHRLNN